MISPLLSVNQKTSPPKPPDTGIDSEAMKKASQKAFSLHPRESIIHLYSSLRFYFKTVFTDYQRQQFCFLTYTLEKSLQKVVKNYYEYIANSTNESNFIFINSLAFQRSSRLYLTEDMYCNKRSLVLRAELVFLQCFALTGICSMPRAGTTEPVVTAEKCQCPPGTGKYFRKTFKNLMSRYFTWPCRHFIKKPNSTAQKRVGLLLLYDCISKRTLFKRVTEKKTFNSKFYERRIKTR